MRSEAGAVEVYLVHHADDPGNAEPSEQAPVANAANVGAPHPSLLHALGGLAPLPLLGAHGLHSNGGGGGSSIGAGGVGAGSSAAAASALQYNRPLLHQQYGHHPNPLQSTSPLAAQYLGLGNAMLPPPRGGASTGLGAHSQSNHNPGNSMFAGLPPLRATAALAAARGGLPQVCNRRGSGAGELYQDLLKEKYHLHTQISTLQ